MTLAVEMIHEYTVTQLARDIQGVITTSFSNIKLRGEISGLKRHTSGHIYLSLKDANSVIDAICWRGTAARLAHPPEEGLEVICQGRITTYPARSKYQFIIEALEPAGQGALLKLLEERKRKLAAEGLFDEARKKPLPWVPQVIGVITSATGAVIQDILHRLRERFPVHVLLWPVSVQGENAVADIVQALEGFERLPSTYPVPDLLIIARGGGSLEDLWCFNEEALVRAVFASSFPIISAVGHETDYTLIDLVADQRAPTPTAAAEMAVPVRSELGERLITRGRRLHHQMRGFLTQLHSQVTLLGRTLRSPRQVVEDWMQRLDERGERMHSLMGAYLEREKIHFSNLNKRFSLRQFFNKESMQKFHYLSQRFARLKLGEMMREREADIQEQHQRLQCAYWQLKEKWELQLQNVSALLRTLSYKGVLERGFTLIEACETQSLVTRAKNLKIGERVEIIFADGQRKAQIFPSE